MTASETKAREDRGIETPATGDDPKSGSRTLQVRLAVTAIVVAALAALFWPSPDASRTAPGGFLTDATGRPTPLGPRLAPVTLVHFWATWCPPCIDEIPALQRLEADLADETDFRVAFIAVGDEPSQVEDFLGDPASRVLYDPGWDVARRYGTDQLPETYLVVEGETQEKFVGATDWDDPKIRRRIRRALVEVEGGSAATTHEGQ